MEKIKDNTEAVEMCWHAVIRLALDDYRQAYNGYSLSTGYDHRYRPSPEKSKRELFKFFHSSKYKLITTLDGDYLMREIEIQEQGKAIEALSAILKAPKDRHSLKVDLRGCCYRIPPRMMDSFKGAVRTELRKAEEELSRLLKEKEGTDEDGKD